MHSRKRRVSFAKALPSLGSALTGPPAQWQPTPTTRRADNAQDYSRTVAATAAVAAGGLAAYSLRPADHPAATVAARSPAVEVPHPGHPPDDPRDQARAARGTPRMPSGVGRPAATTRAEPVRAHRSERSHASSSGYSAAAAGTAVTRQAVTRRAARPDAGGREAAAAPVARAPADHTAPAPRAAPPPGAGGNPHQRLSSRLEPAAAAPVTTRTSGSAGGGGEGGDGGGD